MFFTSQGIHGYESFLIAAVIFAMTPGLDTIFVLNKAFSKGRRAAVVGALGVNAGVMVHTLAAAFGLSVILSQSAAAFTIVKWAGAAYLCWLGLRSITSKPMNFAALRDFNSQESILTSFRTGLIANVLNPKVALFVLAFFPQFINADAAGQAQPFFVLGVTYAAIGTIWYIILAWFAATLGSMLITTPSASRWMNRASGLIFILLGARIAMTEK